MLWHNLAVTSPLTPGRTVDLHLHTIRSDGRWTPRQVVEQAAARGLAAIAVTDHDVVGGLEEASHAAQAVGIELVAGIELTADWDGRTIHVLGHGIDPTEPTLLAALLRAERTMAAHVERVLEALADAGAPLDAAKLEKYRVKYAGGASLVLAMVEQGVLRRAKNASKLLRLAADEPRGYTATEAISLIHTAGGVASLAHPVKIRKGRPLLDAADLAPLLDAGLDGIEVWQIVHGPRERDHYAALADANGLLAVGGSDCHGPSSSKPARMGSQRIPYSAFEQLSERIGRPSLR